MPHTHKTKFYPGLILIFSLSIVLSACGQKPVEKQTIKFAVLPIIDSLPMYVALQEGYFDQYNLDVELIPVGSGPERDQLLAARQVDGVINEVLTTIMNNRTETQNSNCALCPGCNQRYAAFQHIGFQTECNFLGGSVERCGNRNLRGHRDCLSDRTVAAKGRFQ